MEPIAVKYFPSLSDLERHPDERVMRYWREAGKGRQGTGEVGLKHSIPSKYGLLTLFCNFLNKAPGTNATDF